MLSNYILIIFDVLELKVVTSLLLLFNPICVYADFTSILE